MFSYLHTVYTYEELNMKMVHGRTKEITSYFLPCKTLQLITCTL